VVYVKRCFPCDNFGRFATALAEIVAMGVPLRSAKQPPNGGKDSRCASFEIFVHDDAAVDLHTRTLG
jgi:hypothetical protein